MNPDQPTRSHDPLARWTALRDQDAALTVTQRALVIAAQHHADRVWNMASRGELPNHPTTTTGHHWSQLTVETYEYLRDTGAYAHLSASHPQHVTVPADRVADWLATTVDGGDTIAEQYGIDDTFTLGGRDLHDRIQELVTRAAADRILDTAGHRVQLWQAADEGFLLTVDPPHGPRLASHHLPARYLLPDGQSGRPAAITVLTETAVQVNLLLDELAHQLHAARASATNPAVHKPNPLASRAFPAPGATTPATTPAATSTTTVPAPHPDSAARYR